MVNSKKVKKRITAKPCVTCGKTEYDLCEIVEVGENQSDGLLGEMFQRCRNCGDTYSAEKAENEEGR
jgi:predicted nucleic-acid-binding Zn-ribbon protein